MTRRGDASAIQLSTINTLKLVIVILAALLVFTTYGLVTTRDNFTISIPPNLQHGAVVNVDEFDIAVVHAFASVTFREIHRWENDGVVDYGQKIDEMAPRLTAEYYEALKKDMNQKNADGELKNRTRYALEIDGTYTNDGFDAFVTVIDERTWVVDVNVTIVERIEDFEVKNRNITYPLIVRRGNLSPEKNVWGLVLDGYPHGRSPQLIVADESSDAVEAG